MYTISVPAKAMLDSVIDNVEINGQKTATVNHERKSSRDLSDFAAGKTVPEGLLRAAAAMACEVLCYLPDTKYEPTCPDMTDAEIDGNSMIQYLMAYLNGDKVLDKAHAAIAAKNLLIAYDYDKALLKIALENFFDRVHIEPPNNFNLFYNNGRTALCQKKDALRKRYVIGYIDIVVYSHIVKIGDTLLYIKSFRNLHDMICYVDSWDTAIEALYYPKNLPKNYAMFYNDKAEHMMYMAVFDDCDGENKYQVYCVPYAVITAGKNESALRDNLPDMIEYLKTNAERSITYLEGEPGYDDCQDWSYQRENSILRGRVHSGKDGIRYIKKMDKAAKTFMVKC